MHYKKYTPLFLVVMLLLPPLVRAQISQGGTPLSFDVQTSKRIPAVSVTPPDMKKIHKEDSINQTSYKPYRFAKNLEVDIPYSQKAQWERTPEGWVGRLAVNARQARGLLFYYDKFLLPEGGKLFIYGDDKSRISGAFTQFNNPPAGYFATEMVAGDRVILEYNYPRPALQKPDIHIYEVGYAYRGVDFLTKGFGDSGGCHININCSEGDDWQEEKRGVARIAIKRPDGSYWCTGSLVNNTEQDYTPYLLSADHCAGDASASDLQQWIFYFNYEAESCDRPSFEPDYNTMTGAEKISNGGDGGYDGSDFYLVELNNFIPNYINPYFSGWSRSPDPATGGVSIHHPQGDIKKITTYTDKLVSSTYGSSDKESHWKVYWSETANGYGATEGGSSGSPLFNESGRIVGTLTGGYSSCSNPAEADFYGKFSYSWNRNGNRPEDRLMDWLDPNNMGVVTLSGLGGEPDIIQADFTGDTSLVVEGTANFKNLAVGVISDYLWTFKGGNPEKSSEVNPSNIQYSKAGSYDVEMIVSGPKGSDTLIRKDFVHVKAKMYPNPAYDYFFIDFGSQTYGNLNIRIYDSMGRMIEEVSDYTETANRFRMDISKYPAGLYFVRVNSNNGDIAKYTLFKNKREH